MLISIVTEQLVGSADMQGMWRRHDGGYERRRDAVSNCGRCRTSTTRQWHGQEAKASGNCAEEGLLM